MDKQLQAIMNLKIMALKQIIEYPATYHAIDVLTKIAGWERAAKAGDNSFELQKKVFKIYQEQADIMRGAR